MLSKDIVVEIDLPITLLYRFVKKYGTRDYCVKKYGIMPTIFNRHSVVPYLISYWLDHEFYGPLANEVEDRTKKRVFRDLERFGTWCFEGIIIANKIYDKKIDLPDNVGKVIETLINCIGKGSGRRSYIGPRIREEFRNTEYWKELFAFLDKLRVSMPEPTICDINESLYLLERESHCAAELTSSAKEVK